MISRPLNFLSLFSYLSALTDKTAFYKKDKMRKYNLTEHEWRFWTDFCHKKGLVEIKNLGKKRGRKPIITKRGEKILEKLKEFNIRYSLLLREIFLYGEEHGNEEAGPEPHNEE